MPKEKPKIKNLSDNLKRLSEIGKWFEAQSEVDIEEGLKKVREAANIIKASKKRLKAVENEFEEIKKEIDVGENNNQEDMLEENEENAKDMPF